MILKVTYIIAIGIILGAFTGHAEETNKEAAAVAVAENWLSIVDGGQYDKSWREAAEYFRNAIGREQWVQTIKAVREPLGQLVFRKVKHSRYQKNLPGAPDGEYVVIQFDASFKNKKQPLRQSHP